LYGEVHPGVHGVPWEYVVLVAQLTHKDIWINIPVNASDDYVNHVAQLLKNGDAFTGNQGIPAGTNVYVEYSNEMWHYGFHQGPWNNQAAQDEVAAGGSNLNYDGCNNNNDCWRFRRIAKRTVEIGNQFKSTFGDNGTRIRPVINNAFTDHDADMLKYVQDNYGTVSNYIYGISQTGYYSSADKSSVDAIIAGEEAASDTNKAGYQTSRSIADQFGIHSLVYEGGQDEEGNKSPTDPVDTTLANQFAAARDPRMQDVEVHDWNNWISSGGELYMQFSHVGRYSTYGMWGLSEDLTDQSTGKWKGVDQIMGSVSNPTPTPTQSGGGSGWTKCADEGGNCSFNGTMVVRYGANGSYYYQTATNGIGCNNGVFGDPIVGTYKACYTASVPPSGWAKCSDEGGTCNVSGTVTVAYGANGQFKYQTVTNSVGCNNGVFGDPIVGTYKACYYQ
jgi:hypothetical protein